MSYSYRVSPDGSVIAFIGLNCIRLFNVDSKTVSIGGTIPVEGNVVNMVWGPKLPCGIHVIVVDCKRNAMLYHRPDGDQEWYFKCNLCQDLEKGTDITTLSWSSVGPDSVIFIGLGTSNGKVVLYGLDRDGRIAIQISENYSEDAKDLKWSLWSSNHVRAVVLAGGNLYLFSFIIVNKTIQVVDKSKIIY